MSTHDDLIPQAEALAPRRISFEQKTAPTHD
jgi:hypothetical protein